MTEAQKETLAQEAERHGQPETARAVREFLSTELITERDIQRTHELAVRHGWKTDLPVLGTGVPRNTVERTR